MWPTLEEGAHCSKKIENPLSSSDPQPLPQQDNLKKKKKKRGENVSVGLMDLIKHNASKQRKKIKFSTRQKSLPLKRSANPLDSDQPLRHSGGKKRPDRKKRATLMKRRIACSILKKSVYSPELLDLKSKIFQFVKANDPTSDALLQQFNRITLETESVVNSNVSAVIHSKKFRPYCTNFVTPDLKKTSSELVVTLRAFQDRLFSQNEIKARAKRRYVCGIREAQKFLSVDSVKCLLIGSNLEMEEGQPSFEPLERILETAANKNIPVVFCGKGEDIGYWTLKKRKISVLAILNYEGADGKFNAMVTSWTRATSLYEEIKRLVESKLHVCRNEDDVRDVENDIRQLIVSKFESVQ